MKVLIKQDNNQDIKQDQKHDQKYSALLSCIMGIALFGILSPLQALYHNAHNKNRSRSREYPPLLGIEEGNSDYDDYIYSGARINNNFPSSSSVSGENAGSWKRNLKHVGCCMLGTIPAGGAIALATVAKQLLNDAYEMYDVIHHKIPADLWKDLIKQHPEEVQDIQTIVRDTWDGWYGMLGLVCVNVAVTGYCYYRLNKMRQADNRQEFEDATVLSDCESLITRLDLNLNSNPGYHTFKLSGGASCIARSLSPSDRNRDVLK